MVTERGPIQRGYTVPVLDHGYVKLVDWMGSDEAIVESARTSTQRGFVSWEPYQRCKSCGEIRPIDAKRCGADIVRSEPLAFCPSEDFEVFRNGDLGILNTMYREGHSTPFEMCEVVFEIQVPMDCWRQWIRNRTAVVNEHSTRYTEAIDFCQRTPPDAWRKQGKTNRQGSSDEHVDEAIGQVLSEREIQLQELAREVYEERLRAGVAKEQARKDLPLSNYTRARWKMNLHNLLKHFLGKRLPPAAQLEIRLAAQAVAEIARALFPRSYGFFEEYDLHGVRLSRSEVEVLRTFIRLAEESGFQFRDDRGFAPTLAKLGVK